MSELPLEHIKFFLEFEMIIFYFVIAMYLPPPTHTLNTLTHTPLRHTLTHTHTHTDTHTHTLTHTHTHPHRHTHTLTHTQLKTGTVTPIGENFLSELFCFSHGLPQSKRSLFYSSIAKETKDTNSFSAWEQQSWGWKLRDKWCEMLHSCIIFQLLFFLSSIFFLLSVFMVVYAFVRRCKGLGKKWGWKLGILLVTPMPGSRSVFGARY